MTSFGLARRPTDSLTKDGRGYIGVQENVYPSTVKMTNEAFQADLEGVIKRELDEKVYPQVYIGVRGNKILDGIVAYTGAASDEVLRWR